MLKKIQKFLLLNYPLIWNLKIIPILLVAFISCILTFILGYYSSYIDFNTDYYNDFSKISIFNFAIYIFIILILIVWLVAISKNNAFKYYYPTNIKCLYIQWLLIGLSVFSVLLVPFSFERGTIMKTRSYITKKDLLKEAETILMAQILLPTQDNIYLFQDEYYSEINNDRLVATDNSSDENHLNNAQYSLLNYEDQRYYSPLKSTIYELSKNTSTYIKDEKTVKDWLVNEKTDSIKNLMSAFITIQKKYNVPCNLTIENWFSLLYNSPSFEITPNRLITDSIESKVVVASEYYISQTEAGYNIPKPKYYITSSLSSNFEKIAEAYNDNGSTYILCLLYATLCITMLTFAFRVTSGKDWLIALVSMGLLSLIIGLFIFIASLIISKSSIGILYPLMYIVLFAIEILIISNKKHKGRSGILVNHIIGLFPLIPLLILYICNTSIFTKDNLLIIYTGNLFLSLIIMPFILKLIIRWKGLPEK